MKINSFAFLVLFFVKILGSQSADQASSAPATSDSNTFKQKKSTTAFGESPRNKTQISASDQTKYINGRRKHVRTLDYPVKISYVFTLQEDLSSFSQYVKQYNYFITQFTAKSSTIEKLRTDQTKYVLSYQYFIDDPNSDDMIDIRDKVISHHDGVAFDLSYAHSKNLTKWVSAIKQLRQILPNHLIFFIFDPYFTFNNNTSSHQLLKIVDDVDLFIIKYDEYRSYNDGKNLNYSYVFQNNHNFTFKDLLLQQKIPGRQIAFGSTTSIDRKNYIDAKTLNGWMNNAYKQYGPFAGFLVKQDWKKLVQQGVSDMIKIVMRDFQEQFRPFASPYNCSVTFCRDKIERPIILGYMSELNWLTNNGDQFLESLMVPGYTKTPGNPYNFLVFTFWLNESSTDGTKGSIKIWESPYKYLLDPSMTEMNITQFGTTDSEIRRNLKKIYNDNGIKILISAFGSTGNVTTCKKHPNTLAESLAKYVKEHHLDGVDVDWEDKATLKTPVNRSECQNLNETGPEYFGDDWLIEFTIRLRELLPNHIITHAPEAVLFNPDFVNWTGHSYINIDRNVGKLIDFYNIQYYNMDDYEDKATLLQQSNPKSIFSRNTSVTQLIEKRKISGDKIVIGKPLGFNDVFRDNDTDTAPHGYISNFTAYGEWIAEFYKERQKQEDISKRWNGGIMYWQVYSNLEGDRVRNATKELIKKYRGLE